MIGSLCKLAGGETLCFIVPSKGPLCLKKSEDRRPKTKVGRPKMKCVVGIKQRAEFEESGAGGKEQRAESRVKNPIFSIDTLVGGRIQPAKYQ